MSGYKVNRDNPTKELIINTALKLFYKNGYESTSVGSIVRKANVSKGAFYHYFKAKDDILETVTSEIVAQGISVFKNIAEDKKLNALDKLNKIIGWTGNSFYLKKIDFTKGLMLGSIIVQTDNTKLFDKFKNHSVAKLGPYLEQIFRQGVKEKIFNIPYPEETCEFFIEFMSNYKRKLFLTFKECGRHPAKIKIIYRKLKFLEDTINKILGAPPGSVSFGPFPFKKINEFITKDKT